MSHSSKSNYAVPDSTWIPLLTCGSNMLVHLCKPLESDGRGDAWHVALGLYEPSTWHTCPVSRPFLDRTPQVRIWHESKVLKDQIPYQILCVFRLRVGPPRLTLASWTSPVAPRVVQERRSRTPTPRIAQRHPQTLREFVAGWCRCCWEQNGIDDSSRTCDSKLRLLHVYMSVIDRNVPSIESLELYF